MFTETKYEEMIESIFKRFPSVQNTTFGDAYKPGLQHIEDFCAKLGRPERSYRTVHVAGTNGKGSVANMLASVLAGSGLKVGLYTSPHILDFRERMRVVDGRNAKVSGECSKAELVSREYVYDFIAEYSQVFEELDLSFFEITTGMAFEWFAAQNVDIAVIEVGLGGRLDSTNVIVPDLSIVTSIGLDHCDLLGDTLEKIAFEKAGIFKPGVSAVIGETRPETAPVFKKHFTEINLADTNASLVFAEEYEPSKWYLSPEILKNMDLRGSYQKKNLRTVLTALDVLQKLWMTEVAASGNMAGTDCESGQNSLSDSRTFRNAAELMLDNDVLVKSLTRTASRMDFHGRWERLSTNPEVLCDIGHNAPALAYNFAQLKGYIDSDEFTSLIIVYGVMADKNFDAIMPLFPENATWIFTTPQTKRAEPASRILERYSAYCRETGRSVSRLYVQDSVRDAVALALKTASSYGGRPLVYVGGSTFVVSEATKCF